MGVVHRIRLVIALAPAVMLAALSGCGGDDPAETAVGGATGATPSASDAATTVVDANDPASTVGDASIAETTALVTVPPVAEVLPLNPDGLGLVSFGDEPEAVIEAVTEVLGTPSDDTGWSEPLSISACPGTEVRRVEWSALALFFGDESAVATGTRHLFAYAYGTVEDLEAEPAGLATPEGIGLGSTVAYLRAAYPSVVLEPGETGVIEPSFFVDDNLSGRITGDADDDLVTVVIGGDPCGV
jgi:hypothetical protein